MKLAALILAAGQASRFGSPKVLLKIGTQTLLQRSCHLALEAHCSPTLVISGAHHSAIAESPLPPEVHVLENPNWQQGMGNSLALGISKLLPSQPDAVLILLADQPAITLETISRLQQALTQPDISIALSDHGTSKGPPALFRAQHFPALQKLTGDAGAKKIATQHPHQTTSISAPEARWDIDEPSDWEAFEKS